MTSHVHCKDRYREALSSDRMHHWQVVHESPVCTMLDNTHLYCSYDQCPQQCAVGFQAIPRLLVAIIAMSISFLI
jgi:hypothetical protein